MKLNKQEKCSQNFQNETKEMNLTFLVASIQKTFKYKRLNVHVLWEVLLINKAAKNLNFFHS